MENEEAVKKYFEIIGFSEDTSESEKVSSKDEDDDKLKNAFDFANSCRDKEIDRFWSRGLYFWGFIASSFAAYMAVFSAALGLGDEEKISLTNIIKMSYISKTALLVLAFICFVFCFSWMLAHKGSKFWQCNWENHVSYLGAKHIGKIYTTWLDSKSNGCAKNPFSSKAYDYSVSKLSYLCSLLLTFCSFLLVIFNLAVMITPLLENIEKAQTCIKIVVFVVLVVSMVVFIFHFFKGCIGNKDEKIKKMAQKKDKVVFHSDNLTSCEKKK